MGAVCAGCFQGSDQEEKIHNQGDQRRQQPHVELQRHRGQQQPKATVDDGRSEEARANAAIAAQKRAEAFEKSAVGKAKRTAIAAAKSNPAPNRNEPNLKWTMG